MDRPAVSAWRPAGTRHGLASDNTAQEDSPHCKRLRPRGDLAPGKDPAALAGFFGTIMNGLRVAAKTNPDDRTLIQRMGAALTVLD